MNMLHISSNVLMNMDKILSTESLKTHSTVRYRTLVMLVGLDFLESFKKVCKCTRIYKYDGF